MTDIGSVVPRNSVIEANQSGLIAEPLLDITPQVGGWSGVKGREEEGLWREGSSRCWTSHRRGKGSEGMEGEGKRMWRELGRGTPPSLTSHCRSKGLRIVTHRVAG